MLKVVICDDEKAAQEEMKKLVVRFSIQHNEDIDVVCFSTGKELLNAPFDYDILFLDIRLNDNEDGISIGQQLRKMNNTAVFILSTMVLDRHRDGYKAGVHRYLEKPINVDDFNEALESAIKTLRHSPVKLDIRFKHDIRMVDVEDIYYIESSNRKRYVYLKDEKLETLENLEKLQKRLPAYMFYRPQKSFIVNLGHIEKANKTELVMQGGRPITFVKGRYEDFNRCLMRYLGGRHE